MLATFILRNLRETNAFHEILLNVISWFEIQMIPHLMKFGKAGLQSCSSVSQTSVYFRFYIGEKRLVCQMHRGLIQHNLIALPNT
jgi:hypothetical protein